jgi:hypothetical protein
MKRSGFRRKALPPRPVYEPRPIPADQRRGVVAMVGEKPATAIQRFDYVRSERLLEMCRCMSCQLCGRPPRSDPAHSNQSRHGKGAGIKASDVFVAALCRSCHQIIDQGSSLSQEERVFWWTVAWVRTVCQARGMRQWPLAIPFPEQEYQRAISDPAISALGQHLLAQPGHRWCGPGGHQ